MESATGLATAELGLDIVVEEHRDREVGESGNISEGNGGKLPFMSGFGPGIMLNLLVCLRLAEDLALDELFCTAPANATDKASKSPDSPCPSTVLLRLGTRRLSCLERRFFAATPITPAMLRPELDRE
jgi:hypothetical protein